MLVTILLALVAAAAGGLFVQKWIPKAYGFIPAVLFGIGVVWTTTVFVPQGSVGVISEFGIVDTQRTIPEGTFKPFGVWPWQSVSNEDTRVDNLDFHGANHFVGKTNDKVVVTIELTQPVRINPDAAPWLKTKFRTGWREFILPYVGASLRDAVANKPWLDVYQADRAGFAALFHEDLQKNLTKILQENGIPKEVADKAFILSDAQIGGVTLPKEIEDSLNKQNSVKIDQQTSILRAQVAENDVKTREAEGKGYSSLLTSLPQNVPPQQAAEMMRAQAELKKVQLLDDAIKAGRVQGITFVIGGGNTPSPAVSTTPTK